MSERAPPVVPPSAGLLPHAHYLDMPAERRAAAHARVAIISASVRAFSVGVPLTADVDDFRRVLVAHAPKVGQS